MALTKIFPRNAGFRMPAEWNLHSCCWMLWPYRLDNWRANAAPAKAAFVEVVRAISKFERVNIGVPHRFLGEARFMLSESNVTNFSIEEIESNDCWARDSGPTFLLSDNKELSCVRWIFNAWGMLYEDIDDDVLVSSKIAELAGVNSLFPADFVLEGGSIHVDGEGTCITTEECLLHPNRNPHLSKEQIEENLKNYLNVSKVLWLPKGLYGDEDTNGHIDNFCCFFRPGSVLLAWTDDETDPQYSISMEAFRLLSSFTDALGRSLEIVKIPIPTPMFYTDDIIASYGDSPNGTDRKPNVRLAGSYVNFYIANGGIIVPAFGCPQDKEAIAILQNCFPNYEVVSVPGIEILYGGGNIHCITQQQPGVV